MLANILAPEHTLVIIYPRSMGRTAHKSLPLESEGQMVRSLAASAISGVDEAVLADRAMTRKLDRPGNRG